MPGVLILIRAMLLQSPVFDIVRALYKFVVHVPFSSDNVKNNPFRFFLCPSCLISQPTHDLYIFSLRKGNFRCALLYALILVHA